MTDLNDNNRLTITAICDYCNAETSQFKEVDRYLGDELQEHLFLCYDCYSKEGEKMTNIEGAIIAFKSRLTELKLESENTDKYDDTYVYGYYHGMVDAFKEVLALLEKGGEK